MCQLAHEPACTVAGNGCGSEGGDPSFEATVHSLETRNHELAKALERITEGLELRDPFGRSERLHGTCVRVTPWSWESSARESRDGFELGSLAERELAHSGTQLQARLR